MNKKYPGLQNLINVLQQGDDFEVHSETWNGNEWLKIGNIALCDLLDGKYRIRAKPAVDPRDMDWEHDKYTLRSWSVALGSLWHYYNDGDLPASDDTQTRAEYDERRAMAEIKRKWDEGYGVSRGGPIRYKGHGAQLTFNLMSSDYTVYPKREPEQYGGWHLCPDCGKKDTCACKKPDPYADFKDAIESGKTVRHTSREGVKADAGKQHYTKTWASPEQYKIIEPSIRIPVTDCCRAMAIHRKSEGRYQCGICGKWGDARWVHVVVEEAAQAGEGDS